MRSAVINSYLTVKPSIETENSNNTLVCTLCSDDVQPSLP